MAIRLHIAHGRDKENGHTRNFHQERVVIGRARSCDVCLPDMAVSTRHAEIRLEGGDYKIVDLGSRNGTFVGGIRLVPHRPRKLAKGDVLGIAEFDVAFALGPGAPSLAGRDESSARAKELLGRFLSREGESAAPELERSLDGTLAAIQSAPEEDTATFCAPRGAAALGVSPREPRRPEAAPLEEADEGDGARAPLPVGPADPLLATEVESPDARRLITHEMPRPELRHLRGRRRGETVFLVAGAFLLVAAVIGLALLLS